MTDQSFDPYAVLQVADHAEPEVIQAAYRTLARRIHPDLSEHPEAQSQMSALNRAWEILGDPTRRAHYDQARAASAAVDTASGAGSAPTRSTWNVVPHGEGAAGPPPGRPWGTVLDFGRFVGWSMGEIARVDPAYLEWLEINARGRRYSVEIDETLRKIGYRVDQGTGSETLRRR